MTCTRCQGCMTKDHFIDLMEAADCPWMEDWHYCLNCGSALDPVMEQHCLAEPEQALGLSSGEWDYQEDEVHRGVESVIRRAA